MTFEELAWGAYLYRLVTNYDSSYLKLFTQESLLARLRRNPTAVSSDDFEASVVNFLNEWGGRHIKKDTEVAGVLLSGLYAVQDKFQSLFKDTLTTINFDHHGELVQDVFNSLRLISWENRGPSRSVTVHLGETFASKLAHVMNPSLFVMWDDRIAGQFLIRNMIESLWDYVGFLKLMQEEAKSVLSDFQASIGGEYPEVFLSRQFEYPITKSLPKFLDEYNWLCSQRNLDTSTPPDWLLKLSKHDHQA
jgi:hypothetical protein